MNCGEALVAHLLLDIQARLIRVEARMATQADVDAARQRVIDAVHQLGTDLQATLQILKDKIGSGIDPGPEVAALDALTAELATLDQQAVDGRA